MLSTSFNVRCVAANDGTGVTRPHGGFSPESRLLHGWRAFAMAPRPVARPPIVVTGTNTALPPMLTCTMFMMRCCRKRPSDVVLPQESCANAAALCSASYQRCSQANKRPEKRTTEGVAWRQRATLDVQASSKAAESR